MLLKNFAFRQDWTYNNSLEEKGATRRVLATLLWQLKFPRNVAVIIYYIQYNIFLCSNFTYIKQSVVSNETVLVVKSYREVNKSDSIDLRDLRLCPIFNLLSNSSLIIMFVQKEIIMKE